jgi:hypothetical protein
MGVPVLRGAGSRTSRPRQAVSFEDFDQIEMFGQGTGRRQPADSGSDHDCTSTQESLHADFLRSYL